MKKTYIAPETKIVRINSTVMLCLSQGNPDGEPEPGVTDSKSYSGGLLWEDDTEEK